MTETPATSSEPTEPSGGVPAGSALLVFATAAAWFVAGIMILNEYSNYTDTRDSRFDISAPQITQIANEFFVAIAPWVIGAIGVTAICIVAALVRRPG